MVLKALEKVGTDKKQNPDTYTEKSKNIWVER